jgi:hypothetical protein
MSETIIDGLRIKIEQGNTGLHYITSPDMQGLLVAKPSRAEALADAPRAIAEIRALKPKDNSNAKT